MDQKRQKAMEKARQFVVYEESEQADTQSEKPFDAMWQSIYDVCKLVHFGIIDDISQEEYDEAYNWLVQNQKLTDDYQDYQFEF